MHWIGAVIFGSWLAALAAGPAQAFCSYRGQLYAQTTLAQEFADSRWVVRARVVAADDHWPDKDVPWTNYHLRVLDAFKGAPPTYIDVFTYRDSGGFYLDKGMRHNIDGEYLLYLNPAVGEDGLPVAIRGAAEVNYSCGQSKQWRNVSASDRQRLMMLSRRG